MGRAVRLIEPVFVPDVLVNGIGDIDDLGFGYRLTFYSHVKMYDGGDRPTPVHVVSTRLILPEDVISSVHDRIACEFAARRKRNVVPLR